MKIQPTSLETNLEYLKLRAILANYPTAAKEAAKKEISL